MTRLRGAVAAVLGVVALAACGGERGGAGDAAPADSARGDTAAAPSATTPADSAAARWTVDFTGVGPVRVGMSVEEAKAALGGEGRASGPTPTAGDDPDGCQYFQTSMAPAGVSFMLNGGRIARVDVDSSAVSTAAGARVGDSEGRVRELYAGRFREQPHKYTSGRYLVVTPAAPADTTHRLVFETDGQRVTRYRAGRLPEVEWVEGCS